MKKVFFLCLLALFYAQSMAAQSPWTRGKASFYAQAAWQTIPTYDAIYDQKSTGGKRNLEREISENTFQLYGEYGVTRRTTVLAAVPFRFVRSGDVVGSTSTQLYPGYLSGFGNITLAVRQNFLSEKVAFSGQLRIDMPMRRVGQSTGLSTGYDALTVLPSLSLGKGYGRCYWFIYGGWGARGIFDNHFVNAGAEAGLKWRKHWLILFSDYWQNTGSKIYVVSFNNEKTGLFLPNQSYWAFGGKGIFSFNRFFGGILTAAGAFDGDLVPSRPAYSAGIYFKWD